MKEKFDASTTLIGLVFSVTSLVQFLVRALSTHPPNHFPLPTGTAQTHTQTCPFVAQLSFHITRLGTLRLGLLILIAGGLVFGLVDHVAGFLIGRVSSLHPPTKAHPPTHPPTHPPNPGAARHG